MGDAKAGRRKRAVGTRDRVLGHLAAVGEVSDEGGKASILLAAAVGYPGSSVAFAQLLTGMERAGLIERDIRGKRTYRIAPGRAAVASVSAAPVEDGAPAAVTPARPAAARPANPAARRRDRRAADPGPGVGLAALAGADGLDYDELARRLLIQVVQQLTNPPGPPYVPSGPAPAGRGAASRASADLASADPASADRPPLTRPPLTRKPWPAWSRSWPVPRPGSAS